MKLSPKNLFWSIILIALLLVVVLLGTIIKISNPIMWMVNIAIAAFILAFGYFLGQKSKDDNQK